MRHIVAFLLMTLGVGCISTEPCFYRDPPPRESAVIADASTPKVVGGTTKTAPVPVSDGDGVLVLNRTGTVVEILLDRTSVRQELLPGEYCDVPLDVEKGERKVTVLCRTESGDVVFSETRVYKKPAPPPAPATFGMTRDRYRVAADAAKAAADSPINEIWEVEITLTAWPPPSVPPAPPASAPASRPAGP